MDWSARAFFIDRMGDPNRLMHETMAPVPEQYRTLFLKNARTIAPIKTGALRKSIVTQVLGNEVKIGWRAKYAAAVDEGGHTDKTAHFAPAKGYGRNGKGYMTRPGWHHPYRTGSAGFKKRTVDATEKDMSIWMRSKGFN